MADPNHSAVTTAAEKSTETAESRPTPEAEPPPRASRLRRFTKKLLDRKELTEDTKELLGSVLETGDRAKSEMVRLIAREVRNYLEELKIKDDLMRLVTNHSLEVKLSLHLQPLTSPVQTAREKAAAADAHGERDDESADSEPPVG